MKTGLIIYTSSLDRLANFYMHVFDLNLVESDSTYALLSSGKFELVLLVTEDSKNAFTSSLPRESTPIKPTFFVTSRLGVIAKKVKAKGGTMYPPKDWTFGGHSVCDGHDCEGNIFQLRLKEDAK